MDFDELTVFLKRIRGRNVLSSSWEPGFVLTSPYMKNSSNTETMEMFVSLLWFLCGETQAPSNLGGTMEVNQLVKWKTELAGAGGPRSSQLPRSLHFPSHHLIPPGWKM